MELSGRRDRYYDGFGMVSKGRGQNEVPLSIRDYIGGVPIDKTSEFMGANLLPTSLQGVDSYGRALVPVASANFTMALAVEIAKIGDEFFGLFQTQVVSPLEANKTIQGKIYPVSPMDPTTEHTTGTTFTQYGYSISRFMAHFAKFIEISVEFLQTDQGKREFFERLNQLAQSYVLTAVATVVSGLMVLPGIYTEWSSKIPGSRSNYSATKEIEESASVFAFSVKGNPDVLSSVISERAPTADTLIISKKYTDSMVRNRTRDPRLYQESTYPVYEGQQTISRIFPLPSLPTGVGTETKDMLMSRASYATFRILPPMSPLCDAATQGAGSLTFYDHRSRQMVTLSRAELYRNVTFDAVDQGKDDQLKAGAVSLYDDQIKECTGEEDARFLIGEGLVVIEIYSWATHAALACNRSKIKFLTTEPQAIDDANAAQNIYALHLRVRTGIHSEDAGQSALCFHSPFVAGLSAGGSTRFYNRRELLTENKQLLAPAFNANGLIVVRVSADDIRKIDDQIYIPPLGSWTNEAKAVIGNEPIKDGEWDTSGVLSELEANFKAGEFNVGSFDTVRPKLPEVCFRDGYTRAGFFADQSQPSVTSIEGCAPHGDYTTAELKGDTAPRTRTIENPEIFKRARLEKLAG